MATAKKAVAAKGKANLPARWDEELAKRARAQQKMASELGTGGDWLSFKGGILAYKGNAVPGNAMDIVIPSFVLENQFYGQDKPYNPDSPQSPICYAFGSEQESMRPHEKAPSPQSAMCKDCQWNEWGTADTGRGKACKNVVRIGVIPADVVEKGAQAIADAPEAMAKIPVTSCKAFGGFVSQLEAVNLPPLAFVTEISVTPDPKNQFKVNFNAKEQITDGEAIGALLARADRMDKTLPSAYPDFGDDESQNVKRSQQRSAARKPAAPPVGKGAPRAAALAAARRSPAAPAPRGKAPPAAAPRRKF